MIIIIGNINIIRDWGWAPEYVEAMQLILRDVKNEDQIICTGKKNSLKYFIETVFDKLELNWEKHININKQLFRPNEIMKSYGNPEKLLEDIGWKAKTTLDNIIEIMINDKLKQN